MSQCTAANSTSASTDSATMTSSLLGQLTSSAGPSVVKHDGAATKQRLIVMTDLSQIDALQVSRYIAVCFTHRFNGR